jgi:hypothetical protein
MYCRTFLAQVAAATYENRAPAAGSRWPRILLRPSWQTVNIGDMGHTPGILQLLFDSLPKTEITLWPSAAA